MSNYLKLYCAGCGGLNEYTLHKPKFCQSCGNSLSMTASASKSSLSEEKDPENLTVNISSLEFETVTPPKRGQTIGDLMASADLNSPPPSPVEDLTPPIPAPSPEEVVKQFQKEAGTLRRS